MTIAVVVYVFDNVEVLDFAGPFEVFTTASRVFRRRSPGQPEPIRARAGLNVLPDFTLASCPEPGLLLIPGGVVDQELQDAACGCRMDRSGWAHGNHPVIIHPAAKAPSRRVPLSPSVEPQEKPMPQTVHPKAVAAALSEVLVASGSWRGR
jgi:hypothetical protein